MKVCRAKSKQKNSKQRKDSHSRAHHLSNSDSEETVATSFFHLSKTCEPPLIAQVRIDGIPCDMEIDTGAGISLVSKVTFRQLWKDSPPTLEHSDIRLRTYTGEMLNVLGAATVMVEYQEQREKLQLCVVKGSGPSLMGRDWLRKLTLDWRSLNAISAPTSLNEVLDRHKPVFREGLGMLQGVTDKLHIDPTEHLRFCKARTVPYAMRERVELESIDFSEWASLNRSTRQTGQRRLYRSLSVMEASAFAAILS